MVRHRKPIVSSARTLALILALLALPPTLAQAQFFGYGGYPGMAYGYGYPGIGYGTYGYGYPAYGYGGFGYGYPGMGYGGYGYGYPGLNYNFGYGYGYPGLGFGYGGYSLSVPGFGFWGNSPYNTLGFAGVYPNPLFGLGLTPLGVNSALGERYLLGRGAPTANVITGTVRPYGYSSSYSGPGVYPR